MNCHTCNRQDARTACGAVLCLNCRADLVAETLTLEASHYLAFWAIANEGRLPNLSETFRRFNESTDELVDRINAYSLKGD